MFIVVVDEEFQGYLNEFEYMTVEYSGIRYTEKEDALDELEMAKMDGAENPRIVEV